MKKEEEKKDLPTKEEVLEEMLDYLEDKYDEEFEVDSIDFAWWGNPGGEHMLAYPKDRENDDRVFALVRTYEEDGSVTYEDGYVGYVMEPIVIEKFEEIVKRYFPDSLVFTGYSKSYLFPKELTIDSGYDEFKKYVDEKIFIGSRIFASIEDEKKVEELLWQMEGELRAEFKIARFSFYGYTTEDYEKEILGKDKKYLIAKRKELSIIEKESSWGIPNHNYIYEKEKGK
ncbi:MAG TPA: hypothetical protein VK071_10235 [Tissierellales bacterium]|nr:hypothetical protein [Tissierellales bacterium]